MEKIQEIHDVCKEVLTILGYFNNDIMGKIPSRILKKLSELAADSKLNCYIDKEKDLLEQNISEKSKDLIALLYYSYIANEKEKYEFSKIWNENEKEYQKALNKKYNLNNIFKNVDKELIVQIAGIAVVLGHTFPIFFGFKGGKGVATSLGVLLMSNWQIGLICLVFAVVLMVLTKMVSVGSCGAAVLFPVLTLFINENYTVLTEGKSGKVYFVYSVILAIIVLYNHRANIKRIMSGTENKLSFGKKENN